MSDDVNYINLERLRTFLQEVKRLIPTNYATKTDLNNYLPKSGGELSGTNISRNVDNETLHLYGGIGYGHGAFLQLTGKDERGNGDFNIQANNGSVDKIFTGKADGTLTWDDKNIDVIEEQGEGYIRYSNGIQICWGNGSVTFSNANQCSQEINLPKPFVSNDKYVVTINSGGGNTNFVFATSVNNNTSSMCVVSAMSFQTINTSRVFYYQAIGKWK